MVSICDDLRRLDTILLLLDREFQQGLGVAHNQQPQALLSSACRLVQSLEKKARALHLLEAAFWSPVTPPNSSGGAAPLALHAPIAPKPCEQAIPWQHTWSETVCVFSELEHCAGHSVLHTEPWHNDSHYLQEVTLYAQ